MRLALTGWLTLGALLLPGSNGLVHAADRYTTDDAVAQAQRSGKLQSSSKSRRVKKRKRIPGPLSALVAGYGTVSRQHVNVALQTFIGPRKDRLTEADASQLRQVLSHPNFVHHADSSAKQTLIATLKSYEDSRPGFRLQRWESRRRLTQEAERDLFGY